MKKFVSILVAVLAGFVVSAKEIKIVTDDYVIVYDSEKEISTDNVMDYLENHSGDLESAVKRLATELFADEHFRYVDLIEIKDGNYKPVWAYLLAKSFSFDYTNALYSAITSGNEVSSWIGHKGMMILEWQFFLCRNDSDNHSHLYEGCVDSAKRYIMVINQEW